MAKYMDSGGLSHLFTKLKSKYGEPEAPYTEVEWVESNGQQFIFLDWKPPIATWGFEADFLSKNAVGTGAGAWNSSTNMNGFGTIFGTRNAAGVNQAYLSSYSNGLIRCGNVAISGHKFKTDKTRQTISLIGNTLTSTDGTVTTITRGTETANSPYTNMAVFALHTGARRAVSGNFEQPGSVRIYSLKFYDGTDLKVDLVGAVRVKDGTPGLYDKVGKHFYPANGLSYGDAVGTLGEIDTVTAYVAKQDIKAYIDNRTNTRMLRATVPELDRLDDGQKITVMYSSGISASTQTTELAGWDDTGNNSYVYLKLTLSDGSTTDWIPCYYATTTRLTTHYGSQTPVMLTYRENVPTGVTTTSVGYTVARAWYADANYYTDSNTISNPVSQYVAVKTGAIGIFASCLCMRDDTGCYQAIVRENTTGTTKTPNPNGFRPGETVCYSTTTYAANANITGDRHLYTNAALIDARYSFNVTRATGQLTPYEPIYLVGTLHEDGLFYLDSTWWTQNPNDTGKVYIHVGGVYDCTTSNIRISIYEENIWYVYDGTRLVELDHKRILMLQSQLGNHTVASDVPANAVFTDTTALGSMTGTLGIDHGGTGATTAANAWTALGGGSIGKKNSLAASDIPAHASTATTYGAASTTNYGHAKLSSATDSSSEALAATPKAVKAAYDLATTANTLAGSAMSAATGALAFKVTYSVSNSTVNCAAHVYSAGAEVTSDFADSCFQWYYDTGNGWTSLGTGKTKTVTALSEYGGNVKCDFTPPEE